MAEVGSNRCENDLGELRENDDSPECAAPERRRRLGSATFEIANANVAKQEHDEVLRDSSLADWDPRVLGVAPPQRSHSDHYKKSIFHMDLDKDGRPKVPLGK